MEDAGPQRYEPPPLGQQVQAALLAALCAVLFLGEALLPGRSLVPFPPEASEPLRSEALAEGRVQPAEILRGNATMGDKYNQSLAWDRITQRSLVEHWRLPLWTRDIGGGVPFVPQMGQIYQPWNLLLLVVPSAEVYGPWYFLHLVLLGWLAYRFLRRIGSQHRGALLGVVCVVIGLWTQARIHHNVILSAALPFFPMLSSIHQLFHFRGGARTAGWLGLWTGISWLGGLPQVSLLMSYVAVGYAGALALVHRPGTLSPLLWTGAGMVAGGLVGMAQMGPVLLAASDTARAMGTTEALAGRSLHAAHLLAAVWPDLLAWPGEVFVDTIDKTRTSWTALLLLDHDAILEFAADKYPETAFAIGIPALVLVPLGLLHRARTEVVLFATAVALGLATACAVPPFLQLTQIVPGMQAGDLRRLLFLCGMGLPVLAALGFDRWCDGAPPTNAVGASAILAISSAVLMTMHLGTTQDTLDTYVPRIAVALAEATPGFPDPAKFEPGLHEQMGPEAEANRAHLVTTYGRAALIAALASLLLMLRRWRAAPWVLIALAAVELLHAGHGTIVPVANERVTTPPRILRPVLEATRAARADRPRFQRLAGGDGPRAPLLRPNIGAFHGIEDMAAYNPLPPRRMEEFFAAIEPEMVLGGAGVDLFRRPESLAHPLVDVVGIRWILTERVLDLPGHVDRTPAGIDGPFHLYERTTCQPRAVFLSRIRIEPDRDKRLALLADRTRQAATEVILETDAPPIPTPHVEANASVEITAHEDERVVVRVRNEAAGYLRLADPYDPGWRATANGTEIPVYAADHYLRAVHLEPGEHEVVFTYDGAIVSGPRWLALLGLVAIGFLVWWGRRRSAV